MFASRALLNLLRPILLLATMGSAAIPSVAQDTFDANNEVQVNARKAHGAIVVDVSMTVPASRSEVWSVLTDYDHMAEFFSTLSSSRIVGRKGDKMQVEQKGTVAYGPLRFGFESVREIE